MSTARSALCRSFRRIIHSPRTALPPRTALLQHQQRAFTSSPKANKNEDEGNADFKGQLYDSTNARVERDRAEQARFASIREAEKEQRGTPFWVVLLALGFGLAGGAYFASTGTSTTPSTSSTAPLAKTQPPKHDVSPSNLQAAWADFRDIVGEANVSTQEGDKEAHAGSEWSSYDHTGKDVPFAVLRPESTEQVSAIMKVCHKRKIPVTAYSGGTSLEGHFAATRGGICIDFTRMDQILKLHKEDLDVVVQPAVGWENLNQILAEDGLFFPPDPGPGAMIGGMIGTGCSGTNAYRYGTMKDWVLSLTVVLADGTVIKTKQRPRKSSAGYDLTRTFIGSEGTLGLVTEATLKVTPLPQSTSVAVCSFPSIRAAADCVFAVVGAGVPIAAIEILDDVQMKCINAAGSTSRTWKEAPTLFFKFSGSPAGVKEHISIVQGLAKKSGSKTFDFARNSAEATELWSARKEALWSVMAARRNPSDRVWTTDVAVPISRLPDIIDETKADIARSGLVGSIVGHVGDGNFHSILLFNEKEHEIAEAIVHRMVKRAIEMEGTATGEHGVGLVKRDYLPHEIGNEAVDLMRKASSRTHVSSFINILTNPIKQMKQAFDPLCLLNCDKIIRSQQPAAGEVHEW
ncbi:FAD-binding domain-containing protein [Acrodontium crateriforme]|uniref:FAD-binding domain-containing protein n=1 Tax=Acrodontium crateriforme TaxID=150365 RepID=A0AAQ3R480_9PEZI|nr:FAD-binding domain-containing protein [Acrodontium crateriforme]